jgi:mycoredoxin
MPFAAGDALRASECLAGQVESSREVFDLTNATNETAKPRVLMYTTSWCGDCRMAKRYFQQAGVEYDEIDIEDVPEAAEQVMKWARGNRTVPTMLIGDTVVVDWDRKAVADALAKAGLV